MFLHQEFCDVESQVFDLRTSKNAFEILPLLWGSGKQEGEYIIKQITVDKIQQDNQGNTYAVMVNVTLIECEKENSLDKAQQDARKNGFATGDKNPAAKTKRKNPVSCQKQISDYLSSIRSSSDRVNSSLQGFNYQPIRQNVVQIACEDIITFCAKIIVATQTHGGCIYENDKIRTSANNVRASAVEIKEDVYNRAVNVSVLKSENLILQSAVASLTKEGARTTQKAIIP
jgi:hypothetical protein